MQYRAVALAILVASCGGAAEDVRPPPPRPIVSSAWLATLERQPADGVGILRAARFRDAAVERVTLAEHVAWYVWSPSGRWLAYMVASQPDHRALFVRRLAEDRVWEPPLLVDTGPTERIVSGVEWSPQRDVLLFETGQREVADVRAVLARADGTIRTDVLRAVVEGETMKGAEWDEDGTRVLVSLTKDGDFVFGTHRPPTGEQPWQSSEHRFVDTSWTSTAVTADGRWALGSSRESREHGAPRSMHARSLASDATRTSPCPPLGDGTCNIAATMPGSSTVVIDLNGSIDAWNVEADVRVRLGAWSFVGWLGRGPRLLANSTSRMDYAVVDVTDPASARTLSCTGNGTAAGAVGSPDGSFVLQSCIDLSSKRQWLELFDVREREPRPRVVYEGALGGAVSRAVTFTPRGTSAMVLLETSRRERRARVLRIALETGAATVSDIALGPVPSKFQLALAGRVSADEQLEAFPSGDVLAIFERGAPAGIPVDDTPNWAEVTWQPR